MTTFSAFYKHLHSCHKGNLLSDVSYAMAADTDGNLAEHTTRMETLRSVAIKDFALDEDRVIAWLSVTSQRWLDDPAPFWRALQTKSVCSFDYRPTCIAQVAAEPVQWLYPGALARGEVTDIGAEGGTGKGLYIAGIVSALTRGLPCPFFADQPGPQQPGSALLFSGEDHLARVLRPRLEAAGADLDRVQAVELMDFFNRTGQSLTMASEAFRRLVTDAKPDLVVVDPLQSFLPADCNMAARNEMRAAVLPLAAVCKEVGAAGVIVQHTNKKLGVSDRQRLADSSDLWDQSRCVFLLGTQHSTGLVYASNEKNNYAPKLKTALMQVEQCAAGPRLTLHSYTDLRDSDFVKQRQGDGARGPAPALNQSARQALLQLLQATDTQRMESDALKRLVQTQLGCGRHTVDTAYSALVREGRLKKTMLQRPDGKKCWYTTVLPSPQAEQTTLAP